MIVLIGESRLRRDIIASNLVRGRQTRLSVLKGQPMAGREACPALSFFAVNRTWFWFCGALVLVVKAHDADDSLNWQKE